MPSRKVTQSCPIWEKFNRFLDNGLASVSRPIKCIKTFKKVIFWSAEFSSASLLFFLALFPPHMSRCWLKGQFSREENCRSVYSTEQKKERRNCPQNGLGRRKISVQTWEKIARMQKIANITRQRFLRIWALLKGIEPTRLIISMRNESEMKWAHHRRGEAKRWSKLTEITGHAKDEILFLAVILKSVQDF